MTELDSFRIHYASSKDKDLDKQSPDNLFIEECSVGEDAFNPFFRQMLSASGPLIGALSGGMTSAFSAILLPQLKNESRIITRQIDINIEQESWIASMTLLPMAFGCIFGGIQMEKFGRKNAHYMASVINIIGWILIYFSTNIEMLLIGRSLTGLSVGFLGPSSASYIAEISQPKYRGWLLSGIALALSLGVLSMHLLGTFLTWTTCALITISTSILCIILMYISPESPVWLINKNKGREGTAAFFWLKGTSDECKDELQKILASRYVAKKINFSEAMACIKQRTFLKPLIIMNVFFITLQFSGNNAIVFYSVSIMQKTVSGLDKYLAMLIVDIIRVGMSIIACLLTKKVKVRTLTMLSGIGSAFSLFILSLFVYLAAKYPAYPALGSIPIVFLISYIIFASIGLVPLPWTICGEIFAPITKGLGTGISTFVNFLVLFIVIKTSPKMFENLGTEVTFTIYGCFALVGTAILWFILPETKDKTLGEIEEQFKSRKKPSKRICVI